MPKAQHSVRCSSSAARLGSGSPSGDATRSAGIGRSYVGRADGRVGPPRGVLPSLHPGVCSARLPATPFERPMSATALAHGTRAPDAAVAGVMASPAARGLRPADARKAAGGTHRAVGQLRAGLTERRSLRSAFP